MTHDYKAAKDWLESLLLNEVVGMPSAHDKACEATIIHALTLLSDTGWVDDLEPDGLYPDSWLLGWEKALQAVKQKLEGRDE